MSRVSVLLLVASMAGWVVAQGFEDLPAPDSNTRERTGNASPMIQERQQRWLAARESQLQSKIRQLERTRETLGERHPSMPQVKAEIDALESQLGTWRRVNDDLNSGEDGQWGLDELGDAQLQALVLQMAIKIDQLETRIGILERRQRQR